MNAQFVPTYCTHVAETRNTTNRKFEYAKTFLGILVTHPILLSLHGDRHCRRQQVCAVATDDQVDLVDVEQLGIDAGYRRRIGLIIIIMRLRHLWYWYFCLRLSKKCPLDEGTLRSFRFYCFAMRVSKLIG